MCAGATVAFAQPVLRGTVVDGTGAAVPGVTVLVELGLVRHETVTGPAGAFEVGGLSAGPARVSASLTGFRAHRADVAIVEGGATLRIVLEPAPFVDLVTVTPDGRTYRPTAATTATRLDLPVLETPQAVSVVTARVVQDRQIVRMAELADTVAGVRASPGYGGLSSGNFYMRGFRGSFTGGNLRDGFRDYTFLSARDIQGIEQTEFLKGPASVIYGQQEVGGIVNTVLKKPRPDRFVAVGLVGGGFGFWRPTIDANTPLTADGSLLFRFNGAFERADSHRDRVENDSVYLAPAVVWVVSPDTRLRFNVELQRYDYVFDTGYPAEPEMLTQPASLFYGEPDFNRTETRQGGASLELSHAFSANWNIRVAANGLASEATPGLINPVSLAADRVTINRSALRSEEESRNYSLQGELYGRLRTGPLRHTIVTGIDAVRWNFRYVFESGVGGAPPVNRLAPVYGFVPTTFAPFFGDDTTANIAGFYVQDQIQVSDRIRVLAGARVDRVDQQSDNPLTDAQTSQRRLTNVSPRLGVLVLPARSTSLYASYTNSFLPQYGVSRTGEQFDPQRGRQFEVGVKQNAFGDRLLATVALYRLRRTNVPTPDGVDPRFSILSGEQGSQGVEVEASGQVARSWNVIGSYAFTDAEVLRDNRLRVGSRLIGVPRHSGGIWTTYDIDRGALSGVQFGAGLTAASEREARLPNVPTRLPSYRRVDAMVGYRARAFTLQLNVKNLNDVVWYEAQGANLIPQATRHALLALTYRFQ